MTWQETHQRAIVADTHNDLLNAVVLRPVHRWGAFFRERWLPQLREGSVNIQVLPVWIDLTHGSENALRQTVRMIESGYRAIEANSDDVALCLNGADVDAALDSGRIACVLALESAPGVDDDVELLQTMHRLGVRIASLAHFGRTQLADGSAEDDAGSRLTRAGVAAVELMEKIGMMFDVSHLGVGGVEHVLEISSRPLIATHSSARQLRDHHRNLTDEQLKGIAATGGVVCVNFFAPFLHETDFSVDRLVDHFEHMVSVIGIDHVGMGPDFVKEVMEDTTQPGCDHSDEADLGLVALGEIPGLEGPAGLPLVTEALVRRGWAEDDIRAVLGENVRRLFQAELGVAR